MSRQHNVPTPSVFCTSFVRRACAASLAVCALSSAAIGQVSPANAVVVAAAKQNNLGVAYINQQLLEKAHHKFEDALRTDPGAVIPLINEGLALLYLNKLPEAEETLRKATVAAPGNVHAWYSLGVTHYTAGNQAAALADFQRAATLDPKDGDTHYFLATILSAQGKYDDAIAEYNTVLATSPLHASAQFGLARALRRKGDVEQSRLHLQRFQEITEKKIGTLMSAVYGEQGRYAKVQDMLGETPHPGPMLPITFAAATPASQGAASQTHGGGVCVLDLKGDGSHELVTTVAGEGMRVFHANADGTLQPLSATDTGLAAKGDGVSCAVGDFDSDGKNDLALALTDRVLLFRNLGGGKFADVTDKAGLKSVNTPAGLTFVDFDHDGDLDLYVAGQASQGGGSVLWRNNGNSTFTQWTEPTGLAGSGETTEAVLSDLNNDRAVDLVVSGKEGAPQAYLNQREGAFKHMPLYSDPALPPARALAIADVNKDGFMDVIATHAAAPGITLWRNVDGAQFQRIPLAVTGATAAWGITPIDFDNDGWIDLAALVETANGTELRIFRNDGGAAFTDVSQQLGLNKLHVAGARSLVATDVNHDGAADLVVAQADGTPLVLLNQGGSKNHSLRIDLTGFADNKSAIGTKVEVFADGNWQKFEVTGASGYMGQGSLEVLAGLGASTHADIVRLLWPTGVPQDELDFDASKTLALTELDRRGSSCPVLFAWDGTKYTFVSDVIGAGVVGHWISPVSRNQPDSDEWTKIDGSMLRARNGQYSVRFGEPMEEINYVDHLRLVAVDHPKQTSVYPDEKFMTEPPFASGKAVVASASTHTLAGAWDDHGNNVLPQLARRDHAYVTDFTNLPYAGFAKDHTLTLDLGAWSPGNPLRLFLHGYVEYFSATSMYAAWQANITPQPPSIEAQLPDGTWKLITQDMGFPAGLPRTMVVDLTGKLPEGTRRIRLKTNLQIYWDQVLVDNGAEAPASVRTTELPMTSAHLDFRGYPKQVELKTPGDLTYDYQQISMTGPFGWQRGSYTRYGDVAPLLTNRDNQYVIFGSGEDIDAEFSNASLPPLPSGWTRDFFFYADGFVKDMDFYEALPFTVAEMPFHEMTGYPYTARERFPDSATSVRYQLDWNDRMEAGSRLQHFQFNYQPVTSLPIQGKPRPQR